MDIVEEFVEWKFCFDLCNWLVDVCFDKVDYFGYCRGEIDDVYFFVQE